jgi:hypothetical protein
MKLILETDSKNKIAKVIALAKELNINVEQRDSIGRTYIGKNTLIDRILNFEAKSPSSFGDAVKWQQEQRKDRDLPFSK